MHPAKQPGCNQDQLDLFQRAAVKLLGHLDLAATLLCRSDDGIGFAQLVGDGCL